MPNPIADSSTPIESKRPSTGGFGPATIRRDTAITARQITTSNANTYRHERYVVM